jgi:hypothetical protein
LKYAALFLQWQFDLRGDVPSASWNRWPYLCGGTDAGFNYCYVVNHVDVVEVRIVSAAILGAAADAVRVRN